MTLDGKVYEASEPIGSATPAVWLRLCCLGLIVGEAGELKPTDLGREIVAKWRADMAIIASRSGTR